MSDQNDKEQLREKLERIDSKVESIQADAAGANEKVGYIAESAKTFTKGYREILNRHSTQDDITYTVASANEMASVIDKQLDVIRKPVDRLNYQLNSAIPMFAATSASSVATGFSLGIDTVVIQSQPYPFASNSDVDIYARKFSELDPALGATYRGAWSACYTQQHDPMRAALFQLRQVFDHLFAKLAPDDEVRQSAFWSEKPGNKPNDIHRAERLRFAAHRCIRDENKRTAMLESVQETLRSYDRLQEAHKRDTLPVDHVREVFKAHDEVIRRWVDAADQWPPK